MPRKPTLKQKKFIKEYLKTGNGSKSALKVYSTDNYESASVIAHKTLQSDTVKTYMQKIMEKQGLSDKKLTKSLDKVIEAGVSDKALDSVKPKDSLKGIEMAFKLKDRFPAERKRIESASINVNLDGKSKDELMKMLKDQQKELREFTTMVKRTEEQKLKENNEEIIQEASIN